jgi:hypothetical protein
MQLNQPIPPSYPGGDNAYDFILNGNQKPKKGLVPKPKSRTGRIIWVIGGGLALIFILAILFSVILGGGSSSTQKLFKIAQTQTEIVRVSGGGLTKSRDISTRNFVETVAITMTSSQQQTTAYLSSHKNKINVKQLALGQDPKTDAALKSADAAGRYDQELIAVLEKLLASYRVQINEAYKATDSTSQKKLLEDLYKQVTDLTKNQPATSS